MSEQRNNISEISELHKELQDAVQADKMYWIRNEAKIRAVTTSQTYEEFRFVSCLAVIRKEHNTSNCVLNIPDALNAANSKRNIVQAAHLTPLRKEDKNKPQEEKQNHWNRAIHP